jgi:putative peptidoglycan lipid II flippase
MPGLGWPPIMAIAIAAILGGIGQVALQWPALRREGFRYRPLLDLKDPDLRRVILLMGPGTIGLAATQINLFVNTLLATSEGTGAASWLNYAFRLMHLPIGLFGMSIATAVLPAAARHAALNDAKGIRETLSRGLALMLVLNVPATLGLAVLATPIVRLIFERGQFMPSDTAATAAALQFYALGLVGYSAARIASPVFYAIGHSRVPVAAGTLSIAFNILASVAFVRLIGFRGLALSTSLAAMANGALLLFFLRKRLNGVDGSRLALTFVKILAASLVMAGAAYGAEQFLTRIAPGRDIVAQASRLTAAIGAGLLALVLAAKILRIQEFTESMAIVRGGVRKLLGA